MRDATLAVVIPIYNENELLPELFERLEGALDEIDQVEWQVLLVNDGSSDGSLETMLDKARGDLRYGVLDLSRNFGHQAAISAGLAHADADAVVVMDGDLQDPPEVIPELVAAWRSGGEVVLGTRRSRQETGLLRKLGFAAFYRVFQWLTDAPIDVRTGVFGLVDRQVVGELNQLSERNRFLPGLRSWLGFDVREVEFDREPRAAGTPKQTLPRLIRYGLDAIISFSFKPLRWMTFSGLIISLVAFVLAAVFVVKRLMGVEVAQTGFTTLVTLVLFLGGIQLIGIGLLGEYLGRTYDEVKNRPLYVVRRRYGTLDPSTGSSTPEGPPVVPSMRRGVGSGGYGP